MLGKNGLITAVLGACTGLSLMVSGFSAIDYAHKDAFETQLRLSGAPVADQARVYQSNNKDVEKTLGLVAGASAGLTAALALSYATRREY